MVHNPLVDRMKCLSLLLILFLPTLRVQAETLVPTQTDPARQEAREPLFIPWSTPDEGNAHWKKLGSNHVPILKEFKLPNLARDLYIPNPGIGYWVLGGLSEESFWVHHRVQVQKGDELISAVPFKNQQGKVEYWALWAPAQKSYLLKDKMRELGITPARAELSPQGDQRISSTATPQSMQEAQKTKLANEAQARRLSVIRGSEPRQVNLTFDDWARNMSRELEPYIGILAFGILISNAILVILVFALLISGRSSSRY